MGEWVDVFIGTFTNRPYVFVFLIIYLFSASVTMGWRRTVAFTLIAYVVAFLSEFSSIHNGFPYGRYYYIRNPELKELWIFGVPFFDSLSYSFLSYAGYSFARFFVEPPPVGPGGEADRGSRSAIRRGALLILAALLVMLLDVVIDPVAYRGDRWFLGKIYDYDEVGVYFGIPLSNFLGWFLVALIIVFLFQRADALLSRRETKGKATRPGFRFGFLLGPTLYYLVIAFNLFMTFRIGESLLGVVGVFIHLPVAALFLVRLMGTWGSRGKTTPGKFSLEPKQSEDIIQGERRGE